MPGQKMTVDGNEAAAYVAYRTNEIFAIYPITPSSTMGEWVDQWSAAGGRNLWGTRPEVIELQSEGGAAGTVHGALQTGALTATFTASQGLLLMLPNMYKIAGELTPTVFHVAARTVATHALSIFGDHSDVMAVRSTGFAFLASGSVQEIMDFALIAQAATLESRIPFVHFFDGFRSSHEVQKIELISDENMRALLDDELIAAHRARALSPDRPVIRGTAQNPDVFFQARERCNSFYDACPGIVQSVMDRFAERTGRAYRLFDYVGAPDAQRVLVLMGSGAGAAEEAVERLVSEGEKVGLVKVRLFRPFSAEHLVNVFPATTRVITVLDRTKEPGSTGEPLLQDVTQSLCDAVAEGTAPFEKLPRVIGGRYGLSSKEFTPAMVKGVFDEAAVPRPRKRFTVGIEDDVTGLSLPYDPAFTTEQKDTFQGLFFGLGADGTVGANKNSIKIIGAKTDSYAQGYFVYDSRKAGTVTVSHLRFGPRPIRSTYLVTTANFVGCHQFVFLEKQDVLEHAAEGATFLLNSSYGADEVWGRLPEKVQRQIVEKKLKFFVIDAYKVARDAGLGARINTIMQTCFFALTDTLPTEAAIEAIKETIRKSYGKKGEEIVRRNFQGVDQALANLHEVHVDPARRSGIAFCPPVPEHAPEFVREFVGPILANRGGELPVSRMPIDGTFPVGTTKWEKRNIASEIPVWDEAVCIQCSKCAIVCPHGTIRPKIYDRSALNDPPSTFKSADARGKEFADKLYSLQVAPEDCTGCGICVDVCPAKNKREPKRKAINLSPQAPLREAERANWNYFLRLPEFDRKELKINSVKGSQLLETLFEFSGACTGCGETPYVKLLSQLFGDRAVIANATGCSSIYGGNLPATPYAANKDGRGPAWSNSLFEDNAEFGLGFRVTIDKHREQACDLLKQLAPELDEQFVSSLMFADQADEAGLASQRSRVASLVEKLKGIDRPEARRLQTLADMLVNKSVWIIGGDGWAYDIGYGGLDHVLASGRNVNVLVLDTEVYSNTGGQMSKSTPRAAVAKFAAGGKPTPKKDLAMLAMSYGNIYVAKVAMLANDNQTVKAFIEAESYDGPSLILAYSHCIAHGINMRTAAANQKAAMECGHWPLFRFDPRRTEDGKNPLQMDSRNGRLPFREYAYRETRYKMLTKSQPQRAEELIQAAQHDVDLRRQMYEQLAAFQTAAGNEDSAKTN